MKHGTLIAALVCAVLFGCSGKDSGPKKVAVSGVVTMDGKPLVGADVNFITPEGDSGFGKTNAEGKYELAQGAVPGENKVYISKLDEALMEEFSADPEDGLDEGQMEAALIDSPGGGRKKVDPQLIPSTYSDSEKSKLTFTVPEGGTDEANFKLTSK